MAAQGTQPDPGPRAGSADSPGRFGLLLMCTVCAYLLAAFVSGRWVNAILVLLFTGAAVLALRNWPEVGHRARLVLGIGLAISVVMLALLFTTEIGAGIADVWIGVILLGAALMIIHRVFVFATVTMQSIYGVVSAYLILGLMFAAFFAAIDHLGGGHFFASGQPATGQTFQYFSFTTLTTLGYGDFVAAADPGRAVATLEALTGQIFLATLVARLVAQFRARGER
jgi:Ion channel